MLKSSNQHDKIDSMVQGYRKRDSRFSEISKALELEGRKLRVLHHPILGEETKKCDATIVVDGQKIPAIAGEPIAAALLSAGIKKFRETHKTHKPRGIFCAIGRCTDCVMMVDGTPNVRTCVTPVRDGMIVNTQKGLGEWGVSK